MGKDVPCDIIYDSEKLCTTIRERLSKLERAIQWNLIGH